MSSRVGLEKKSGEGGRLCERLHLGGRKEVMSKLQQASAGRENVQVAVRVRPISSRELKASDGSVVTTDESSCEVYIPVNPKRSTHCKTYTFDSVFGPTTTQLQLYDSVCKPVVEEVLQGFNCTIFAYGQTGTGKTFTMEGQRDSKKSLHFNAGT